MKRLITTICILALAGAGCCPEAPDGPQFCVVAATKPSGMGLEYTGQILVRDQHNAFAVAVFDTYEEARAECDRLNGPSKEDEYKAFWREAMMAAAISDSLLARCKGAAADTMFIDLERGQYARIDTYEGARPTVILRGGECPLCGSHMEVGE